MKVSCNGRHGQFDEAPPANDHRHLTLLSKRSQPVNLRLRAIKPINPNCTLKRRVKRARSANGHSMYEYKISVPVESGRACSFAPSVMHDPACPCTLEISTN